MSFLATVARKRTGGTARADGFPSRGGQITPSHPGPPLKRGLFLHLKSGALGLRFPSRLSHMGPSHFGHEGASAASVETGSSSDIVA